MTKEQLHKLFEENPDCNELAWEGSCHDCKAKTEVLVTLSASGFCVKGGAIYQPKQSNGKVFLKCETCLSKSPDLSHFAPTEVYSRIVGYMRPTSQWNKAKQDEFKQRKMFDKALTA